MYTLYTHVYLVYQVHELSGQAVHKLSGPPVVNPLYTARIFEFFVERLCSGLWNVCFSVFFHIFLAFFLVSLYFQFIKGCELSHSFRM